MEIIPVIDLKGGCVVHARRGQRDAYQPIRSPLAPGSDPVAIVEGLLGLYPFSTLYAADLDAIEGNGDNAAALQRLRAAFPALALWVDAGLAGLAACRAWLDRNLGDPVLGSEAQTDPQALAHLGRAIDPRRLVLSLDFRGDQFLGPPALLEDAAPWPERVIAMTLARVGSGSGPDIERLTAIIARAPSRRVFAAGGVRDADDLIRLASLGAAGALIATALHDGRIGSDDLRHMAAQS